MRHLRKRLGKFIKEKRGNTPLRDFAARYGLSRDTVRRLEMGEQNTTLDTLEHLCKVFRCDIADLFPEKPSKSQKTTK